ncbi:MAG: NAD-dependent epimerase [Planctomycetes bacterium]|nr:NAD-dependent epimerase [Planctomycetota bacterium]
MSAGRILVTGAAGFIGSHVAHLLLDRGDRVVGLDNLNDYYDPTLKEARLARLAPRSGFSFERVDVADAAALTRVFKDHAIDRVVHLAAQAGVRYSMVNPMAYVEANLTGFTNILERCRHGGVRHLVYASTSSVYGSNTDMPFRVGQSCDHPLSFYAATKKANELMAHTYAALFGLPCTGLRFFTVYGPWGRPDMALFLFTKAILAGEPIKVFNHGHHKRDFTYIDDIAGGVVASLDHVAQPNPQWSGAHPDPATSNMPWRLFNIGNGTPVELSRYIELIEENLGRKATRELLPMQPGDVPDTCADTTSLTQATGYRPGTPVEVGVKRFIDWYCEYYKVKR